MSNTDYVLKDNAAWEKELADVLLAEHEQQEAAKRMLDNREDAPDEEGSGCQACGGETCPDCGQCEGCSDCSCAEEYELEEPFDFERDCGARP